MYLLALLGLFTDRSERFPYPPPRSLPVYTIIASKLYSKPFLFATIYPMLELPVPISDLGSLYMRMEFHCNKLRVQQSGE